MVKTFRATQPPPKNLLKPAAGRGLAPNPKDTLSAIAKAEPAPKLPWVAASGGKTLAATQAATRESALGFISEFPSEVSSLKAQLGLVDGKAQAGLLVLEDPVSKATYTLPFRDNWASPEERANFIAALRARTSFVYSGAREAASEGQARAIKYLQVNLGRYRGEEYADDTFASLGFVRSETIPGVVSFYNKALNGRIDLPLFYDDVPLRLPDTDHAEFAQVVREGGHYKHPDLPNSLLAGRKRALDVLRDPGTRSWDEVANVLGTLGYARQDGKHWSRFRHENGSVIDLPLRELNPFIDFESGEAPKLANAVIRGGGFRHNYLKLPSELRQKPDAGHLGGPEAIVYQSRKREGPTAVLDAIRKARPNGSTFLENTSINRRFPGFRVEYLPHGLFEQLVLKPQAPTASIDGLGSAANALSVDTGRVVVVELPDFQDVKFSGLDHAEFTNGATTAQYFHDITDAARRLGTPLTDSTEIGGGYHQVWVDRDGQVTLRPKGSLQEALDRVKALSEKAPTALRVAFEDLHELSGVVAFEKGKLIETAEVTPARLAKLVEAEEASHLHVTVNGARHRIPRDLYTRPWRPALSSILTRLVAEEHLASRGAVGPIKPGSPESLSLTEAKLAVDEALRSETRALSSFADTLDPVFGKLETDIRHNESLVDPSPADRVELDRVLLRLRAERHEYLDQLRVRYEGYLRPFTRRSTSPKAGALVSGDGSAAAVERRAVLVQSFRSTVGDSFDGVERAVIGSPTLTYGQVATATLRALARRNGLDVAGLGPESRAATQLAELLHDNGSLDGPAVAEVLKRNGLSVQATS